MNLLRRIANRVAAELSIRKGICPVCENSGAGLFPCEACSSPSGRPTHIEYTLNNSVRKAALKRRVRKYLSRNP